MHSEFTISEEKEIAINIELAMQDMKDFNYTISEVCKLYNVKPEQIELHRKSFNEISNLKTFNISKNHFSDFEKDKFQKDFGYELSEISYSSEKEIDFSSKEEKDFLLKNGVPMILARFGF
jgi:hypothetical protein